MKRRNFIVGAIGTSLVTSTASQAAEDNALAPQQRPFIDHGDSVKTAPFGNNISPAITYYNRVSPYVATAGLLEEGGLEEAQKHGLNIKSKIETFLDQLKLSLADKTHLIESGMEMVAKNEVTV